MIHGQADLTVVLYIIRNSGFDNTAGVSNQWHWLNTFFENFDTRDYKISLTMEHALMMSARKKKRECLLNLSIICVFVFVKNY